MELVSTPHSSHQRRRGLVIGVVVGLLLAVTGLVLVPAALGLRYAVLHDGAMGPGSWRGSVALLEDKTGSDLGEGNVVEFVPPAPYAARGSVVRRITAFRDGDAVTEADAADEVDPWRLDLDRTSYARVVAHVPLVGRLLVGPRPLALAALIVVLLVLVVTRWPGRRGRVERPAGPPDPEDEQRVRAGGHV